VRISIHKGPGRHTLRCTRADGTTTAARTGPGLPHHDLAHYVAERAARLDGGFFGLVAAGRSLAELSDPAVIATLPASVWLAETLARALGASATGGCGADEVLELARVELGDRFAPLAALTAADGRAMAERYGALLAEWGALPDGETLVLDWPE
jgi:hypothetical protein